MFLLVVNVAPPARSGGAFLDGGETVSRLSSAPNIFVLISAVWNRLYRITAIVREVQVYDVSKEYQT